MGKFIDKRHASQTHAATARQMWGHRHTYKDMKKRTVTTCKRKSMCEIMGLYRKNHTFDQFAWGELVCPYMSLGTCLHAGDMNTIRQQRDIEEAQRKVNAWGSRWWTDV